MAIERLYALFQDVADAERAIGALEDHGISRNAIGVVARRPAEQDEAGRVRTEFTRLTDQPGLRQGEPEVVYEAQPSTLPAAAMGSTITPTSSVDTSENVATVGKEGLTTTTPQDAAAGAAVGGGVGLIAGILLAAAVIAVPGVGIVLGGGALAAAIGAAAATTAAGAVAGGVTGYLRDMGMPEQAAQRIADRLHEGDYLVTVDADTSQYDDLKLLLTKYHAVGIDTGGVEAGADIPPAATVMPVEARTDVIPPITVVPTPAVPAPGFEAPPGGTFDLRESQLVEPVVIEPTRDNLAGMEAAPRYPANPALAQETEPIVATHVVPAEETAVMRAPGLTPDEETAQAEQRPPRP